MSTRKPYPSDLSDEEWALIAPLVPANRGQGRQPPGDLREVVNALFYHTAVSLGDGLSIWSKRQPLYQNEARIWSARLLLPPPCQRGAFTTAGQRAW